MWSRRKPGEHQRSEGFILVEVLVTAAVAAVLLAALMRAFSSVWGGIGAVREETEAMLVARAVLEASTPRNNLAVLTQEGMSGRYAWTIAIASAGVQVATFDQQQQPQQQQQQQPQQQQPQEQQQQQQTGSRQDARDPQPGQDPRRSANDPREREGQGAPWTLYRIAVAVRAPSGRRTTLETFRLSRPR